MMKKINSFILVVTITCLLFFFGSALITLLSDLFPDKSPPNLEIVSEQISTAAEAGATIDLWSYFIAIVILSPLLEEIVFRGLLWKFLDWIFKTPWVTIPVTSISFAVVHVIEGGFIHVLGVLPLAFFLGFIRHWSKSLWACIFVHFLTNLLGFLLMML